jgi:transcriptional regulator with XRE-family HTH domain
MNSIDMLDALKNKYGLDYDKDVADLLHLSTTFISKVRRGEKIFGSDILLKIAELLDLGLDDIARAAMAERAKDPKSRKKWLSRS